MLSDFNFIATTFRGFERAACSEVHYLLQQLGDLNPQVHRTGIGGLVVGKTSLDPVETVKMLRELLHQRPYEIRYMCRFIPIQKVVRTDAVEIKKGVAELCSLIGEKEKFRVTVEKRLAVLSSRELIENVAADIKRKVDLEKPDKIVLIEIVGKLTGISVVAPSDMLHVLKEKVL
ncbi:MAG: THUMP domain-containing protein [Candidatus Bathyarchaeia archaeon]